MMNPGQKEAFDDWFRELLHTQDTCLLRDVLRDCKAELKMAFGERKPFGDCDEKPDTGESS